MTDGSLVLYSGGLIANQSTSVKVMLISYEEAFKKYKSRLDNYLLADPSGKKGTTFMACKLAREVFFGDDVLAVSTPSGKFGLAELDKNKLDHLMRILHSKLHEGLTESVFKEKFRSHILTSLSSTCKRSRKNIK